MQFNASEQWIRRMAEAEDGANVCIGSPCTEEQLAEFTKEMEDHTIPEIVKIVQQREELAEESRKRFIR